MKVINIIDKLINPIVIPQKHDNYTRKVFDGTGDGGGGAGGVVKAITRTASAVKNTQFKMSNVSGITKVFVINNLNIQTMQIKKLDDYWFTRFLFFLNIVGNKKQQLMKQSAFA